MYTYLPFTNRQNERHKYYNKYKPHKILLFSLKIHLVKLRYTFPYLISLCKRVWYDDKSQLNLSLLTNDPTRLQDAYWKQYVCTNTVILLAINVLGHMTAIIIDSLRISKVRDVGAIGSIFFTLKSWVHAITLNISCRSFKFYSWVHFVFVSKRF